MVVVVEEVEGGKKCMRHEARIVGFRFNDGICMEGFARRSAQ